MMAVALIAQENGTAYDESGSGDDDFDSSDWHDGSLYLAGC